MELGWEWGKWYVLPHTRTNYKMMASGTDYSVKVKAAPKTRGSTETASRTPSQTWLWTCPKPLVGTAAYACTTSPTASAAQLLPLQHRATSSSSSTVGQIPAKSGGQ